MKKLSRFFTVCGAMALALSLLAPAALAKSHGEGKGRNKDKDIIQMKGNNHGGDSLDLGGLLGGGGVSVSEARRLASSCGFTGYQGLPPGIAKNLGRGKPLPPGIAKRMVPQEMLVKLPDHPGYEWRIAGQDLVLVQIGSSIVSEVLSGVFQ